MTAGGERISDVPWQIWIVVVLLALEGIANLLAILGNPMAAVWLAAKCLFIVGLIRRWRVVFILFLVERSRHVLVFAMLGMLGGALINLLLVLLAGSTWRRFFPERAAGQASAGV